MKNEPVAWYNKNSNDYLIENIGQPSFQIQEFIDAGYIPLYTHPAELTDEEITQVFDECYPNNGDGDVVTLIDFARAILRKAQEK